MLFKTSGLYFIFLMLVCGCNDKKSDAGKPNDLLSEKQLEEILCDIHKSEAAISFVPVPSDSLTRLYGSFYGALFKKHNITPERFERSFDYYLHKPVIMDSVYARVLATLTAEESLVRLKPDTASAGLLHNSVIEK